MPNIQACVHSTPTDLAEIRDEWRELRLRQPVPHLDHDPDWLVAHARGGATAVAVSVREEGRLVGIAPLLVRPSEFSVSFGFSRVTRFPVRMAELYGGRPLLEDENELSVRFERLFEGVAEASGGFHMILVEGVRHGSPLERALRTSPAIRRSFWVMQRGGVTVHRFIDLPASFEEYLTKFSGKTRSRLRGKLRKLEAACGGAVEMMRVTDRDQVPEFLRRVEQVSRKTWQARCVGQRVEADAATIEHYGRQADRGWLRSYVLSGKDGPIAYVLGYQADGVYYLFRPGYDPDWAAYSPGTLLFYLLIEDLFAWDTPRVFDFGFSDSEYKQLYGNRVEESVDLYLIRKSPYMALARAVNGGLTSLRRITVAGIDRLNLRDPLRRRLRGQKSRGAATVAGSAD